MAEPWFVENDDGTIAGPFHERQVSADLMSGKITTDQKVRQGKNGVWCPASRVREIFQQLEESGWYIQATQDTYGPFTADRLLELHRVGELSPDARIRQGNHGDWKQAADVVSLWQSQPASTNDNHAAKPAIPSSHRTKWSTEPIRHYMLPLELAFEPVVANCHRNERLKIRQATEDSVHHRLAVIRTNDQTVGYLNQPNSQQLIANRERGITHIALFSITPALLPEIAIILCPPGTTSDESRRYIEMHFSGTMSSNA